MHFAALGKHTLTFSSSLFDVVSDVINSLNFMGYYKNSTQIDVRLTDETKDSNSSILYHNHSNVCSLTFGSDVEENGAVHQIWGIVSMILVFLPGIISGFLLVVIMFFETVSRCNCKMFGYALIALLISLTFPFVFLFGQLVAIVMLLFGKEKSVSEYQFFITAITNIEASVESVGQLCLQLFTILYGYPSGLIQKITIATSFIQIARCAILNDMEARFKLVDKRLTCVESLWETISRLPAYISTIIFKVASLVLTMACLRVYAIIPIALMVSELILISWIRVKNNKEWHKKILVGCCLVFSNIGVVNSYTLFNNEVEKKERDEEIINFVRRSSIITFIHHLTALILIMVIGWNYPDTFEHWTSPNFLLSPCETYFYFVFTVVILIGVYSLTVVLYRAHHISTLKRNETKMVEENEEL